MVRYCPRRMHGVGGGLGAALDRAPHLAARAFLPATGRRHAQSAVAANLSRLSPPSGPGRGGAHRGDADVVAAVPVRAHADAAPQWSAARADRAPVPPRAGGRPRPGVGGPFDFGGRLRHRRSAGGAGSAGRSTTFRALGRERTTASAGGRAAFHGSPMRLAGARSRPRCRTDCGPSGKLRAVAPPSWSPCAPRSRSLLARGARTNICWPWGGMPLWR